jgi:glycosyltransferase involved in cell wall biosynthesis
MEPTVAYSILIPAYNAAETLQTLLQQIKVTSNPESIIVVDDGSTDQTERIAKSAGVTVLRHEHNRGKGAALRTGFEKITQDGKVPYVLCMDADLQHSVADIPTFLQCAAEDRYQMIIGNRLSKIGEMPYHRRLSNRMTSYILSKLTGQNILDSQCGFRLIKRELLETTPLEDDGYQMESEMILKVADQDLQIGFVNIATVYRSESSSIRNVYDTFKFIALIWRVLIFKQLWFTRKNEKR